MNIETDTQEAETIKPLNMRQQKFVDYYVTSGNATRAAEAAGYAHANHQAFRLLGNISVKASIEAIRDEMAKDTEDRRDKWINALEQLGTLAEKDSDRLRAIEQLFKAEGWVAPAASAADVLRPALEGVDVAGLGRGLHPADQRACGQSGCAAG